MVSMPRHFQSRNSDDDARLPNFLFDDKLIPIITNSRDEISMLKNRGRNASPYPAMAYPKSPETIHRVLNNSTINEDDEIDEEEILTSPKDDLSLNERIDEFSKRHLMTKSYTAFDNINNPKYLQNSYNNPITKFRPRQSSNVLLPTSEFHVNRPKSGIAMPVSAYRHIRNPSSRSTSGSVLCSSTPFYPSSPSPPSSNLVSTSHKRAPTLAIPTSVATPPTVSKNSPRSSPQSYRQKQLPPVPQPENVESTPTVTSEDQVSELSFGSPLTSEKFSTSRPSSPLQVIDEHLPMTPSGVELTRSNRINSVAITTTPPGLNKLYEEEESDGFSFKEGPSSQPSENNRKSVAISPRSNISSSPFSELISFADFDPSIGSDYWLEEALSHTVEPPKTFNRHQERRCSSSGNEIFSPVVVSFNANIPQEWSEERVTAWLRQNKFGEDWIETFKKNNVSGSKFLSLVNYERLKILGPLSTGINNSTSPSKFIYLLRRTINKSSSSSGNTISGSVSSTGQSIVKPATSPSSSEAYRSNIKNVDYNTTQDTPSSADHDRPKSDPSIRDSTASKLVPTTSVPDTTQPLTLLFGYPKRKFVRKRSIDETVSSPNTYAVEANSPKASSKNYNTLPWPAQTHSPTSPSQSNHNQVKSKHSGSIDSSADTLTGAIAQQLGTENYDIQGTSPTFLPQHQPPQDHSSSNSTPLPDQRHLMNRLNTSLGSVQTSDSFTDYQDYPRKTGGGILKKLRKHNYKKDEQRRSPIEMPVSPSLRNKSSVESVKSYRSFHTSSNSAQTSSTNSSSLFPNSFNNNQSILEIDERFKPQKLTKPDPNPVYVLITRDNKSFIPININSCTTIESLKKTFCEALVVSDYMDVAYHLTDFNAKEGEVLDEETFEKLFKASFIVTPGIVAKLYLNATPIGTYSSNNSRSTDSSNSTRYPPTPRYMYNNNQESSPEYVNNSRPKEGILKTNTKLSEALSASSAPSSPLARTGILTSRVAEREKAKAGEIARAKAEMAGINSPRSVKSQLLPDLKSSKSTVTTSFEVTKPASSPSMTKGSYESIQNLTISLPSSSPVSPGSSGTGTPASAFTTNSATISTAAALKNPHLTTKPAHYDSFRIIRPKNRGEINFNDRRTSPYDNSYKPTPASGALVPKRSAPPPPQHTSSIRSTNSFQHEKNPRPMYENQPMIIPSAANTTYPQNLSMIETNPPEPPEPITISKSDNNSMKECMSPSILEPTRFPNLTEMSKTSSLRSQRSDMSEQINNYKRHISLRRAGSRLSGTHSIRSQRSEDKFKENEISFEGVSVEEDESNEDDDDSDSDSDDGLWAKKPPKSENEKVENHTNANINTNNITSHLEKFKTENGLGRSNSWAVRPPAEVLYENLERFFPNTDLDKPILDVSIGSPPTSPIAEVSRSQASSPATVVPSNSLPEKLDTASNVFSPSITNDERKTKSGGVAGTDLSRKPRVRNGSAGVRRMKTIRTVAREASEAHKRYSRQSAQHHDDNKLVRRLSTKMWGQKVIEVTPKEIMNGYVKSTLKNQKGEFKQFAWVKGELIGKGTFGRVYLALNVTTGEMIAVKQVDVPKHGATTQGLREVIDSLHSEVSALKDLEHLNIVQYLGFEETKEHYNLFLEYVPGGSVGSCIRIHGRFEEPLIRFITIQVLRGLAYLHSCGILHRDLKADNLLLDLDGVCKISDFNISKRSSNIYANDAEMSMQGTIFWMAPEVIDNVVHNERQGYSAKVDIWSLGCVVLEMFAGRRPWSNLEAIGAIYKIGKTKLAPPIPEDIKPYVSEEGKDFIDQCFQVDPEKRPTAKELLRHRFCRQTPGFNFNVTKLSQMIRVNGQQKKEVLKSMGQGQQQ